jgi:hypothetical protein
MKLALLRAIFELAVTSSAPELLELREESISFRRCLPATQIRPQVIGAVCFDWVTMSRWRCGLMSEKRARKERSRSMISPRIYRDILMSPGVFIFIEWDKR